MQLRASWHLLATCLTLVAVSSLCQSAWGQIDFDREPINYSEAAATNRVSQLQQRLVAGDASLVYDDEHGYLPSLLQLLDVPVSSQMLVFSKTSFQPRRISPRRPRAIYFGDDVAVGWVQQGDFIEISTADPQLGAVFYTLAQQQTATPKIVRDRGQCLTCHATSRTSGVPGHLVRSVYPAPSGQPRLESGSFTTDFRSPFSERWGGWYVTGTHGNQRHMGNVVASDDEQPDKLDREAGANLTDLSEHLNTSSYLAPHSDIVALMVLEHQTRTYNLMTRASFETRSATHYDKIMNEVLERPEGHRSETTQRRIEKAGGELVDALLFVDEFALQDPVAGTSTFAEELSDRGPRDKQGRSLRELELTERLMKYRCSYLIYSATFDQLPHPVKDFVYQRLFDILSGVDTDERYAHLGSDERTAILEILRDTKPNLPAYWTAQN